MTEVVAVKCPECESFIYPRVVIDNRKCPCGSVMIMGDGEQFSVLHSDEIESVNAYDFEIGATEQELVADWRYKHDRLGIIQSVHKKNRIFEEEKPLLPVLYRERPYEQDIHVLPSHPWTSQRL